MNNSTQDRRSALNEAVLQIPYARFLGVRAELHGDELTLVLPFADKLIGNPLLPALHGGVVGAFMELTAVTQLAVTAGQAGMGQLPKTIDISIDYLRSGRPTDTFARARVVKVGRRIANCFVEAWQQERAQPIASLRGHFLMRGAEAASTD
jgi:uncharacterized protein (TIGR00369 family)